MPSNVSRGRHGEFYPKHPILLAVVALPFYVVAGDIGLLAFNLAQLCALVLVMWVGARRYASDLVAFALMLWFAFGTLLRPAAYNFAPDVLSSLLVVGAIVALLHARCVVAGLLLGLSVWAKWTNAIFFPVAAVALAARRDWRSLWRFGAAAALPIAGLLGLNAHMFGSPFVTPYDRVLIVENHRWAVEPSHRTFFTVPFWRGLWTQLTHPTLGLVAGAPPFLLALPGFALLVPPRPLGGAAVGGACARPAGAVREIRAVEHVELRAAFPAVRRGPERAAGGGGAGVCPPTRAPAPGRCSALAACCGRGAGCCCCSASPSSRSVYVFFVSAGRFTHWPTYLTFLDDQAEGFRALPPALRDRAAAGAAGEAEPVRPGVEAALVLGRQPVRRPLLPLLGAGAGAAAGGLEDAVPRARAHRRPVRGVRARQPAGARRHAAHRSRPAPAVPRAARLPVALAIAVFAFANPTLYNLARAGVYEAAIVGGHAFLIAGLLFAFRAAICGGRPPARRAWRWPASAGRWRSAAARRSRPRVALLVARPAGCGRAVRHPALAAAGARARLAGHAGRARRRLLLTYNKLRFDAWFDFGRHYQLSWIPFSGSSLRFCPPTSGATPCGRSRCAARSRTSRHHRHGRAGAAGLAAAGRRLHRLRAGDRLPAGAPLGLAGAGDRPSPASAALGARRAAAGAGRRRGGRAHLGWRSPRRLAAAASFLVPLSLFWATMRFLGDTTPALTLAGTLGWWLCYARFRERPVAAAAGRGGRGRAGARHGRGGRALGFDGPVQPLSPPQPGAARPPGKTASFC